MPRYFSLMKYILLINDSIRMHNYCLKYNKQGIPLMGRNRTGPPCRVNCPTAHTPGPAGGGRPSTSPAAGPPAGSVTDDAIRRRQTTRTDSSKQNIKQYWPIRRASNNAPIVPRATLSRSFPFLGERFPLTCPFVETDVAIIVQSVTTRIYLFQFAINATLKSNFQTNYQ